MAAFKEVNGIIRVLALVVNNENPKYKEHYRPLSEQEPIDVLPAIITIYTTKRQIGFTVITKDNDSLKFHIKREIHKQDHKTPPETLIRELTRQAFGEQAGLIVMSEQEFHGFLQ